MNKDFMRKLFQVLEISNFMFAGYMLKSQYLGLSILHFGIAITFAMLASDAIEKSVKEKMKGGKKRDGEQKKEDKK